jgi:hypothetical protein
VYYLRALVGLRKTQDKGKQAVSIIMLFFKFIALSMAAAVLFLCFSANAVVSAAGAKDAKSATEVDSMIKSRLETAHAKVAGAHAFKSERKAMNDDMHNALSARVEAGNSVLASKVGKTSAADSISSASAASNVGQGAGPKMQSTLQVHGVDDALIKEINNMAASMIPRETIIKHVQTHFPDKRQYEWNDIVIAAIGVMSSAQPKPLDTIKAQRDAALSQARKFDESKKALENKRAL